ncbi:ROK family protein [Microbacterium sp. KSW4-16]|uniref:ROK family protein n=1 Tax=Microbacterium aurugineum TaxID=2851642 RepID=UPI0020BD4761|nr:ROK family protein [Microbacterium aurugineum]MCK8467456.1 ROK family protein [Microbacterium aurugineum]
MIIGDDIGGTKIAVAGFAGDERDRLTRITEVRTLPTPSRAGGPAVVSVVVQAVREVRGLSSVVSVEAVEAVGVGTAGVVDPGGSITSATDAISGWVGFALREALADALEAPVAVVNDVHAAGIAEAEQGAGRGAGGILMVAVGTGVGGAVVLPDGLRRGVTGTAGSVGHMELSLPPQLAERRCPCGGVGHVEAVASGPGLEQTYLEESGGFLPLREVHAAATRGDALAERIILDGARYLGRALANANAALDVGTIVVGGGVAEVGESYVAEVRRSYREAAMPGPSRAHVVPAELGIDAALTGAALLGAALVERSRETPTQPPA